MQAQTAEIHQLPASQSDLLDAPYLRAIAELADIHGPASFTPGGGVRFAKAISRDVLKSLPTPQSVLARLLDLPQDRFQRAYAAQPEFAAQVNTYTVPHAHALYRLVVIPQTAELSASQLRIIANAAEAFGHGSIRLTADVSIRLPNVPNALLRPLFAALGKAGLLANKQARLAA